MSVKVVTKGFVKKDFTTVGLTLILYSLFVLFIPTVLDILLPSLELTDFYGFSINTIVKIGFIFFGSIFPLLLLRIGFKKKRKDISTKTKVPFGETLSLFLVFFSLTSIAIFATTTLAAYFDIPGEFISSIGISLKSEYMNDILYIVMFVLITPILEGYAFRGVLLNVLGKYGKYFAVYTCALIYALAHGSFLEMIPAFIMGLLLNKMSLIYKSIRPTVIVHILFNLLLYFLILIPEEYSLYMTIGLVLIYLLAIILCLTKVYRPIRIEKPFGASKTIKMFYSNGFVIVSILMFILHSILIIIL